VAELVAKLRSAGLRAEFGRYFLVSVAALAIDYALLIGLTELFGVHYLVSNLVALAAGITAAYVGSLLWVFKRRRLHNRTAEYVIFAIVGVGGLGVNEAVLWLLTDFAGLHYALSKIGASGLSFVFNYVVRKVLLFR
jgi:putative flippase GtrA|tara:strand:+ start:195 stop:605 length:411 start_codon:yes stop_codon:yes gene_type:complete